MKSFSDIGQEELEAERLRVLREFPELTSDASDPYLDHIVSFAARICDVPIAAVSILDEKQQLFKAIYGLNIRGTYRSIAFCDHTIRQNKIFEVFDAMSDQRFSHNQLVESDPHIRFYAGVPLVATGGQNLGTLCVIDREPKALSSIQRELLMTLSRSVMEYINHNRERGLLERKIIEMDNFFYLSPDLLCEATMSGYFQKVSRSFITELGYSEEELLSIPFIELVHPDDLQDTMHVMQQLVEQDKSIAFFHNRYRCKDGHYITLSWNAIPHLPTETIYATARNITQLELLQEEINKNKIREIERSKEKFTTLSQMTKMVSHELLEPANLIIGFADVAEEMLKELTATNDSREIDDLAARIEEDLQRIKKHGEFISMVLNKMNSEAEWYQIPSVINRKLQF
jgi:PAS domain S-box-containing protein